MKKIRIVAACLLVVFLSVGISSTASAHPWGHRYGWGGPRIGIGIAVPPVVIGTPYYGPAYRGGYYGPAYGGAYYGRGYARPYAYAHPHYGYHNGYGHYGHHRY